MATRSTDEQCVYDYAVECAKADLRYGVMTRFASNDRPQACPIPAIGHSWQHTDSQLWQLCWRPRQLTGVQ